MRSCIRIPARSLLSKQMFVCSVRAAFENPYICSSLFGECLLFEVNVLGMLVSLVIACSLDLSTPKSDMKCCTAVYL